MPASSLVNKVTMNHLTSRRGVHWFYCIICSQHTWFEAVPLPLSFTICNYPKYYHPIMLLCPVDKSSHFNSISSLSHSFLYTALLFWCCDVAIHCFVWANTNIYYINIYTKRRYITWCHQIVKNQTHTKVDSHEDCRWCYYSLPLQITSMCPIQRFFIYVWDTC